MKQFLVIADAYGSRQRIVERAADLAARFGARLTVVGFVYEHIANLPIRMDEAPLERLQDSLVEEHRRRIQESLPHTAKGIQAVVEVVWEKRVAEWVGRRVRQQHYDLVVKGGHRSETFLYTPTDWQLLRGCPVPVLLFADSRWRRARHVMAAVDLGTKVRSKLALNYEIVRHAASMATAVGGELHVGYVVPYSKILRDLDVVDKAELRRQGLRLAESFRRSLAERGTTVEAIHVEVGPPEKALVNLTAKNRVGLVVLGCVGRRNLAGRVIGNTAEQILRLVKADVLAVKP